MTNEYEMTALIYDAIDRVNVTVKPADAIAKSADTVLMGDAAAIDSMAFVALMAALEERLSRTIRQDVTVVDIMFEGDAEGWTVAALAARLADLANSTAASDRATA